jgi:transposase
VHRRVGWSSRTTATWKTRFLAERLSGLRGRHRGSKPTTLSPSLEARILTRTREAPPDGSTHWSSRKLAQVLKISHSIVAPRRPAPPPTRALRAVPGSLLRNENG